MKPSLDRASAVEHVLHAGLNLAIPAGIDCYVQVPDGVGSDMTLFLCIRNPDSGSRYSWRSDKHPDSTTAGNWHRPGVEAKVWQRIPTLLVDHWATGKQTFFILQDVSATEREVIAHRGKLKSYL